jgi:hypothetical protein
VAAVEEGEGCAEGEAAAGTPVGKEDADRFVGDAFAVDVFVVGEAEWAECRVDSHDGDVGAFGEARD